MGLKNLSPQLMGLVMGFYIKSRLKPGDFNFKKIKIKKQI